MPVVRLAMAAGLHSTVLRDMILTQPTSAEGLVALFSAEPNRHWSGRRGFHEIHRTG
jgi:hypothetical protein